MKMNQLVGDRFKERPADCVIDSHALLVRGGYIRYVANGIYSSLPPLKRITQNIERIIREEMNALDGQEVQFPVVLPASLWEESGRYEGVGSELVRFEDRSGSPLVLGMTHEEAAVQMVREYAGTYSRYPFMIYQIQTKFRDEARPRGGLLRVREFTMKDAYSFHTSKEDLGRYFEQVHHAYLRIFSRVGLPDVIPVLSDSGMMGGNVSCEFMLPSPVGEDSLVLCSHCSYHANIEAAECITRHDSGPDLDRCTDGAAVSGCLRPESAGQAALTQVSTPGVHTIDDLCSTLQIPASQTCKAVVYQTGRTNELVILFLRGDLEANETKLANRIGDTLHPAVISSDSGLQAGFIGPVGLHAACTVLYDRSLQHGQNLVCGGNRTDVHYTGLYMERDCAEAEYHDFAQACEGGICPVCGCASLTITRGIEVGHIFQLGTKYTQSMHMQYTAQDGSTACPEMGCYGIGIGRLAACVMEKHHTESGPLWPVSIAPWQVHLCCVRSDDAAVHTAADRLYRELQSAGLEVLYDDRSVSAGSMFADADLLGAPVRLIISPRNLKDGCAEIVLLQDKENRCRKPLADTASYVHHLITDMTAAISRL